MNKPTQSTRKTAPNLSSSWRKFTVTFRDEPHCRENAFRIAVELRKFHPEVYFARYCNALRSKADFYFRMGVQPIHLPSLIARAGAKASALEPCEGSSAHAAGFDAVVRIVHHFTGADAATRRTQFIDVVHWMHNMLGYDYVEEAKMYLTSTYNILGIFDACIQHGRTLTKKAHARKPSRN